MLSASQIKFNNSDKNDLEAVYISNNVLTFKDFDYPFASTIPDQL